MVSTNKSSNTSTPTDRQGKIWDRFAEGYAKQPIANEEAYQHKLAVTRRYFRPYFNVLEIGCGTGSTAILHAPHVRHILATDISPKMVDIATKKVNNAKVTNVEFQEASVDKLILPKQSIDAVLGLSILHLVKDKDETIRKVHEWLKPGGVFITSTICAADMGQAKLMGLKTVMPIGQFLGLLPNFCAFTKKELKESLKNAGFIIDYEWQPPDSHHSAVFFIGKKSM